MTAVRTTDEASCRARKGRANGNEKLPSPSEAGCDPIRGEVRARQHLARPDPGGSQPALKYVPVNPFGLRRRAFATRIRVDTQRELVTFVRIYATRVQGGSVDAGL